MWSGSHIGCLGYGREHSRTLQIVPQYFHFKCGLGLAEIAWAMVENILQHSTTMSRRLELGRSSGDHTITSAIRYSNQASMDVLQIIGYQGILLVAHFCCHSNRRPIRPWALIETANIAHLHLCTNLNSRVCSRGANVAPGLCNT
jgi:hypothetical protein